MTSPQMYDDECYGTMPPLAEAPCRDLLNHMSTSVDFINFGPSGDPDVLVALPHTISLRELWKRLRKMT